MAALKIDMTIPIGTAGHVRFTVELADIDTLSPELRKVLADTGGEFYDFASAVLAPAGEASEDTDEEQDEAASFEGAKEEAAQVTLTTSYVAVDAADIAAAAAARASIDGGEPVIPWEDVKAEAADDRPPAEIHDPNMDVLKGVLGSRHQ